MNEMLKNRPLELLDKEQIQLGMKLSARRKVIGLPTENRNET